MPDEPSRVTPVAQDSVTALAWTLLLGIAFAVTAFTVYEDQQQQARGRDKRRTPRR